MKQLISATLSEEAANIYNSWEKQKKSQIISEMIIANDTVMKVNEARAKRIGFLQQLLSRCCVALHITHGKDPLCREVNENLRDTIYYQYWD
ncbi:MAG: hypothetical protein [Circular genetic element sp.]|jgi:hypothetical protein|nr:MAG: hypothetical protein [Circular genetic element sp.]